MTHNLAKMCFIKSLMLMFLSLNLFLVISNFPRWIWLVNVGVFGYNAYQDWKFMQEIKKVDVALEELNKELDEKLTNAINLLRDDIQVKEDEEELEE